MDVFLVPAGPSHYELYTEDADDVPDEHAPPPKGFFAGLKHKFSTMLAEAERERRRGTASRQHASWLGRVRARFMRWVAESIAEQRLLWNLRREDTASFFFPSDMSEADAVQFLRKQLSSDFDKHRFWLAIDALLMVGSAALILIPGPNFLGYYFAFRVVGHFFSVRGAKRGLSGVVWVNTASAPLSDLRRALELDPVARLEFVERVATTLRLDHLPSFFQRISVRST